MTLRSGYRLVERPDAAILFERSGEGITAGAVLRAAGALAARLPPGRYVINLCQDRDTFAIGFLAALLGERICLLAGDRSAFALASLVAEVPDCVALTDEPQPHLPRGVPVARVTLAADAGAEAANPVVPADRLAAIVFTSGSTGRAVGHPKHWGALAERSLAAGVQFGLTEAAPTTVVGMVPPQHMYGFETTVLLPLHAPAATWCGQSFFPEDIQRAMAATRAPRLLVTTPLQLRALLAAQPCAPAPETVISATAPLDTALAAAVEQRWGTRVMEIFGATEAGSIASRRTIEGEGWHAYPGVTLRAEDDQVEVLAPHAPPIPLDDRVELLDPAHFRLLGRRQDIVKLGGRRASLAGLNRILLALDGVEDGTFVMPDEAADAPAARLMALIVAPQRSVEGIMRDLRLRIDPVFLPRRILRVAALPRNEFGELSRLRLLALLGAAEGSAEGAAHGAPHGTLGRA